MEFVRQNAKQVHIKICKAGEIYNFKLVKTVPFTGQYKQYTYYNLVI